MDLGRLLVALESGPCLPDDLRADLLAEVRARLRGDEERRTRGQRSAEFAARLAVRDAALRELLQLAAADTVVRLWDQFTVGESVPEWAGRCFRLVRATRLPVPSARQLRRIRGHELRS